MSIEATIQTTLAALVSGRCYPLVAPADVVKPYIVYQVISNVPTVTLEGPSGTERRRVQFTIWDKSYGRAKTLESAAKDAMQAAGFVISISSHDAHEPDTQLYGVVMDYAVWTTPPP